MELKRCWWDRFEGGLVGVGVGWRVVLKRGLERVWLGWGCCSGREGIEGSWEGSGERGVLERVWYVGFGELCAGVGGLGVALAG